MGNWRKGWTLVVHGLNIFKVYPAFAGSPAGGRPALFLFNRSTVAHLTLGYGDNLPEERRSIAPFRFHVGAVDLVMSETGHSQHVRLDRWLLQ